MPAKITLQVTQGKLKGKEFTFDERTVCIIGRSSECYPQLPDNKAHHTISRHHCLLDINPPDIRVRDFGSRNGTYINGNKIGQRAKGQAPEDAAKIRFPEYDLKEGDEIKLGDTVFRVAIFIPAICMECSKEIPEDQRKKARLKGGRYRCAACRKKAKRQLHQKPVLPKCQTCVVCGKDVSKEMNTNRQGEYTCASCRSDYHKIIHHLLMDSSKEQQQAVAIQGYSILKELGRGGMGAVYLARHEKTDQHVALKVMLPQVTAEEDSVKQFLRETAVTKALKHPNIIQLYEHGCLNGTFFFTLEFCDGGSVDNLMKRRGGRLPVGEAMTIIMQLLEGLHYAHNIAIPNVELNDGRVTTISGLVHRDIKPGNFMLAGYGKDCYAKIGDYGLAKAFDAAGLSGLTMTGKVAGTPQFMPRQQVLHFKYANPEVDVWAMAASLYTMLTGKFPRDFQKDDDPWAVILKEQCVPIRKRLGSVPQKLAEVIDGALIDQPTITFKTVTAFKQALEGAM